MVFEKESNKVFVEWIEIEIVMVPSCCRKIFLYPFWICYDCVMVRLDSK